MVQFRKDTSFPYLKIAREHNVPYEVVLAYAEQFQKENAIQFKGEHRHAIQDIMVAVQNEYMRRRYHRPPDELFRRPSINTVN